MSCYFLLVFFTNSELLEKSIRALLKYAKENKLGVFTLTLSLAYIFIGLPAQIYQIWETRAVQAISLPMFLLLALQSSSWVAYGVQRKDWPMIIANTFAVIIVTLCFLFR